MSTTDAPAQPEPTDTATTLEEAHEKGFLGAVFDDGDYTLAGVTKDAKSSGSSSSGSTSSKKSSSASSGSSSS
jgi:hypothetical protein